MKMELEFLKILIKQDLYIFKELNEEIFSVNCSILKHIWDIQSVKKISCWKWLSSLEKYWWKIVVVTSARPNFNIIFRKQLMFYLKRNLFRKLSCAKYLIYYYIIYVYCQFVVKTSQHLANWTKISPIFLQKWERTGTFLIRFDHLFMI